MNMITTNLPVTKTKYGTPGKPSQPVTKSHSGLPPSQIEKAKEFQPETAHRINARQTPILTPPIAQATPEKVVTLEVNEWQFAEENTSYLIKTGGCAAIKIFVESEKSPYALVYHCFGTAESKEAARQISDYIIYNKDPQTSVDILNIQPYGISSSIQGCLQTLTRNLKDADIPVTQELMCLNNIAGEKYANIVDIHLDGSKEKLKHDYSRFMLKSTQLSESERQQKIQLFQKVPVNMRTYEFIQNWSTLSLAQAAKKIEKIEKNYNPVFPRSSILSRICKSIFELPHKYIHWRWI